MPLIQTRMFWWIFSLSWINSPSSLIRSLSERNAAPAALTLCSKNSCFNVETIRIPFLFTWWIFTTLQWWLSSLEFLLKGSGVYLIYTPLLFLVLLDGTVARFLIIEALRWLNVDVGCPLAFSQKPPYWVSKALPPQQFHLFSIWFILSGYLCRVSFCPWVGEISSSVPWSVQRDTSDLHLIVLNWAPVAAVHMHAILMILLLYYPRLLIWLVQFAASYFWFFVGFSISAFWGCPLQLNIPDKLPLRIMMKSFCHFLKCSSEKSLLLTKF